MRTKTISSVSILVLASLARTSLAAPGAVHSVGPPAPAFQGDTPPSQAAAHAVSKAGEVTHRVELAVPRGRNGMQPSVALSYGSRSPLRGGIAAGWTLPISVIRLDTSQGRAQAARYEADGQRLVRVDEPHAAAGHTTYRADGDDSFTRYEKVNDGSEAGYWIARTPDGRERYYGTGPSSKDLRTDGAPGDGLFGGEGRWFLAEERDAAGNQIVYNYETIYGQAHGGNGPYSGVGPVDLVLTSIDYGKNVNDPSTEHHARIELVWAVQAPCAGSGVPVGAAFDFRTGIRRYLGARKLTAVRALVKAKPGGPLSLRRELVLGYDTTAEACAALRGPRRVLQSIQERAFSPDGTLTTLPAQTFEYGPRDIDFAGVPATSDTSVEGGLSTGRNPINNDKAGGWPTTETMRLDLDGDGNPERVTSDLCSGLPKQPWANSATPGQLDASPRVSEGCSLTAQVTHRGTGRHGPLPPSGNGYHNGDPTNYFGYRFMDVNDDGLPDLVSALTYQRGAYRPTEDTAQTLQLDQDGNAIPPVASAYPACTSLPPPRCTDPLGHHAPCLLGDVYRQQVWPLDAGWSFLTGPFFLTPIPPDENTEIDEILRGSVKPIEGGPDFSMNETFWCGAYPPGYASACPGMTRNFPAEPGGGPGPATVPNPDAPYAVQPWAMEPGAIRARVEGAYRTSEAHATGYVPDMHCGHYVLRVYLNKGNDAGGSWFETNPRVVFSPVPLETDQLVSANGAGPMANASGYRAIVDVDGDGYPDGVYQKADGLFGTSDLGHLPFQVWFGTGNGDFSAVGATWNVPPVMAQGANSLLPTGARPVLQKSIARKLSGNPAIGTGGHAHEQVREVVTMRDVNGDGLLDYVRTGNGLPVHDDSLFVYFNTGAGFEAVGTPLGAVASFNETVRVNPYRFASGLFVSNEGTPEPDQAYTVNTLSGIDLDDDGLEDVVAVSGPPNGSYNPFGVPLTTVQAFVNYGDYLAPVPPETVTPHAGPKVSPLEIRMEALRRTTMEHDNQWRSVAGISDLNGDGLYDLVEPAETEDCVDAPASDYRYDICPHISQVRLAPSRPLNVLTAIRNGLGGSVTFAYASSSDTSVVGKAPGYRLAAPIWVAKSMTVTSGNANEADQVTEYHYDNPVSRRDRQSRFGFRGFEKVTTTGPAPATGRRKRTVDTYAYDQDPEGLLQRSLVSEVWAYHGNEDLISVTDTDHVELPLSFSELSGDPPKVRGYAPRETRTTLCTYRPQGTTAAAIQSCFADGVLSRSVVTWTPLLASETPAGPMGPAVLWARAEERRTTSLGPVAAGDRVVTTTNALRHTASSYRLLGVAEETRDGGGALLGRREATFEPGTRALPTETRVFQSPTSVAKTRLTYTTTGNVATIRRPNQVAFFDAGAPSAVIAHTYDEFQLYPAFTTNEADHTTGKTLDLATGATLVELGIPQPDVTPRVVNTIDGLGRVLRTTRTHEVPGQPGAPTGDYEDLLVYVATYVDAGTPAAPRTVTQRRLQDGSNWIETVASLDSLGRTVLEQAPTSSGTATVRRVFDGAGNAAAVFVTNPGDPSGPEALYWTEYDAFGSPSRIVRPDTAETDIFVYGKFTTTYDWPYDGGPWSYQVLERDGLGRLVRVSEGVPSSAATTTYAYDAMDRAVGIVDADGVSTSIGYDLAGHRKTVTRASATLAYDYDLHGNRTRVLHPTPTGVPDPTKYASSWTYDAIDRVVTATPADRDLSNDQRSAYFDVGGAGPDTTTRFTYDASPSRNGAGRLSWVSAPHGVTHYDYTIEGWTAGETRTLAVKPEKAVLEAEGVELRAYDVMGNVTTLVHADGQNGDPTVTHYTYDDGGRPKEAMVRHPSHAPRVVGELVRNAAGAVIRRSSASPSVFQTFGYDAAGRVLGNEIQGTWCAPGAGCTTGVIGGETFAYYENGSPKAMTDGATGRTLDFGYNGRVELVSAVSRGSADYVGRFTYSGSGRVLSVDLASGLPGADVDARQVTHRYTPWGAGDRADPAAVRALQGAGGADVATFVYDPSGNLRQKTDGSRTLAYVYDGNDQLREVRDDATGEAEIYWYDHRGERVLTYRTSSSTRTLRHRFGTTELVADGDGNVKSTTVDVHLGGQAVARVTDGDEDQMEYLFHGALGSLLVAVDEKGKGTARYGYGPFGEVLYAEGPSADAYDRTYEAKAKDALSGLSYFGHRYYDPLTLSWTQADPLYRMVPEAAGAEPRRMSPYTYVRNSPLALIDPDGLDDENPYPGTTWLVNKMAPKDNTYGKPGDPNDSAAMKAFKIKFIITDGWWIIGVTAVAEHVKHEIVTVGGWKTIIDQQDETEEREICSKVHCPTFGDVWPKPQQTPKTPPPTPVGPEPTLVPLPESNDGVPWLRHVVEGAKAEAAKPPPRKKAKRRPKKPQPPPEPQPIRPKQEERVGQRVIPPPAF